MNISPEQEQFFWKSAGASNICDVPGFPYPSYPAFKAAVFSGQVKLGIEYAAARELSTLTKSRIAGLFILAMAFASPLLAVASLALAFITGHWWVLGGTVTAFLGRLAANPYNPLKRVGAALAIIAFIYALAAEDITTGAPWSALVFTLGYCALWLLNRLSWAWAHDALLESEALAAYLFSTRNLHILDHTGRMHDAS